MNEDNFLKRLLERLYDWMPFKYWTGKNSVVQSKSGCEAKNENEIAIGQYNKSIESETSGDSTIFSVGIGKDNETRENAFEVRKSGDIYFKSGDTMKNLQSTIEGGGIEPIPDEEIENLKNDYKSLN